MVSKETLKQKCPLRAFSPYRCGTHATGWLKGAHPEEHEGKVTRQVCFDWSSNYYRWSVNLQWVLSVFHQFFAFKKLIIQLFLRYSSRFSVVLASIHGYIYMYPWDTTKINKLCISRETRIPSLKSGLYYRLCQWHIIAQPFQKNHNPLWQCFTVSIKCGCP